MPSRARAKAAPLIPPSIIVGFDPAVPLDTLIPHPANPRHGDVGAISISMRTNGVFQALVVQQSTRHILSGNHRAMAARAVGRTEMPVLWVDCDDAHALTILLADNKASDLASYDDAVLLATINAAIEAGREDATLYDRDDLDTLRANLAEPVYGTALQGTPDDDDPTPPAAPITQLGDVLTLGRHRVVCGDARDPAVWAQLLADDAGAPVDAVFTDPPYGVAVVGGSRAVFSTEARKKAGGKIIKNDDLNPEALRALLETSLGQTLAHCKAGGAWYVCAPPGNLSGVFGNVLTAMEVWRHSIIWVKDAFVFSRADYHYRHELIFYGWKPGAAHYFIDDRTQNSVWEIPRPRRSAEHPTMKPLALVVRALDNSTTPGQRVADPFLGSGTTLLACEQTGRTVRGIELDPAYCDVIATRWERHTGLSAVRTRPLSL